MKWGKYVNHTFIDEYVFERAPELSMNHYVYTEQFDVDVIFSSETRVFLMKSFLFNLKFISERDLILSEKDGKNLDSIKLI